MKRTTSESSRKAWLEYAQGELGERDAMLEERRAACRQARYRAALELLERDDYWTFPVTARDLPDRKDGWTFLNVGQCFAGGERAHLTFVIETKRFPALARATREIVTMRTQQLAQRVDEWNRLPFTERKARAARMVAARKELRRRDWLLTEYREKNAARFRELQIDRMLVPKGATLERVTFLLRPRR